ncbi:hypothetical protein [Kitasatospora sp. NPDC047058]|uniref:hypothetical protein n=1 Tax=Kitasatospora sp. NPDC047058 TaxID=3155620 RepID=UPI0034111AEC
MVRIGTAKRGIAMTAAAVALAGVATVGLGGTAYAGVSNPPASTTDWFSLYLENGRDSAYFLVCNHQSSATSVVVKVFDGAGYRMTLQDVNTGWNPGNSAINFNPGGCEEFNVVGYQNNNTIVGEIVSGNSGYWTGWVSRG